MRRFWLLRVGGSYMYLTETIAFAALIVSFISMIYAKKSIKISQREYEMKLSSFDIEIIDSLKMIKGDSNILLFKVNINNKSLTKNSFNGSLELNFSDTNATILTIPHNPLIEVKKDIEIFDVNIPIGEKSSLTKWLIFEHPREIFNSKIERYNIKITDIDKKSISEKTYIIKTKNL